jgi:hypothetical protein
MATALRSGLSTEKRFAASNALPSDRKAPRLKLFPRQAVQFNPGLVPARKRFLAAFSLKFEYRNFPDRHWSRRHPSFAIRKSGRQHFEKGIGEACRCGREP